MNNSIAAFLGVCLLFQPTAFAEAEVRTQESEAQPQGYVLSETDMDKLDFMQTIGILTDIDEEDISLNRYITRGEMAKTAVSLYGSAYDNYRSEDTVYSDVKESDDCFNAVNLLHELNIISGYDDGSFLPGNDITVNESVKILTAVMGYTVVAEQNGGYPLGYMYAASECDLFKGVKSTNGTDALTVSQLIPIVYNALEATPLIQIDFSSKGITYKKTKDETLLSLYFDIYKAKGIVTGNEHTSLLGKKKAGLDRVYIDSYEYIDVEGKADGYLGYKVEFYYRDTDDDDELVWLKPDSNCKIVKIASSDIVEEKTTAYSIGYEDGSRDRILQLKDDVSVIYNGVEYSGFTADLFRNADGSFVAISWDSTSDYDVLIVNDYKYYIVESVNVADNTVRDKFDRILECTIDDEPDDVIIEDVEGNDVELADLIEWEGLAVLKSMDGTYFKITVFRNYVQGVLDQYIGGDGDNYVTIDGKEYEVSKNYPDKMHDDYPLSHVIGADTFIVLDLNDKVILIDSERDSMKYGIISKLYKEDFENILYAKVMNDKGLFNKYTLAANLKIDGKHYKADRDNSFELVVSALREGDIITSLSEEDIQRDPDWTAPGDFVMQLIRYKTNEEGKISEIDTGKADNGQNPKQLIKLYDVDTKASRGVTMLFKSNDHTFNKVIASSANTKVFFAPSPLDVSDEDSYAVDDASYFSNDNSYSIIPYGTAFKEVMGAGAVLLVGAFAKKVNKDRIVMFDKAIQTITDDGDTATAIDIYNGSKKDTIYAEDAKIEQIVNGLERGDLFRYAISAKGYLNVIEKVFDAGDKKISEGIDININDTAANSRNVFADIYDRSDEIIKITNVFRNNELLNIDSSEVLKNDLLELHSLGLYRSNAGIAVYDEAEKQIRSATDDDIKTYSENPDKYSRVFVSTSYSEAKRMYIYNYK